MKYVKRVVGWVCFVVGLLVLLQGVSWVVQPKDNTVEAGMERVQANGILGEPPDTIDVLILGNSEAHTAFSPMLLWKQTGYTSYTCGTDAQVLPYSKTMLKRALEKQKPKVVILEALNLYHNMTAGDMYLEELSDRLPVFRYHDRWKRLSQRDFTGPVETTGRNLYKGHVPKMKVDPWEGGDYMAPTGVPARIARTNRLYVQWIQKICQDHGAQLILVSAPSPANWSDARGLGAAAFAGELGCPYLDLNREQAALGLDWSKDTYDKGDHLNNAGATKVTRRLGEYLQALGILTDHRGDPRFSDWDALLKDYEAFLAQQEEKKPGA